MDISKLDFSSRQIYAGADKNLYGALQEPIYQTSTFVFDSAEQGGARFAGTEPGYFYSRPANPTTNTLERRLANLEQGEAAMVTASGMGAVTASLYVSVKAGDEIIADETLYGCTFAFLAHEITELGVKTYFCDFTNPENIKKYLSDKTKVVYFETPCNPTMKVIDIQAVAEVTHAYNPEIKVMVDNTFPSPYLTQPLTLGADVVIQSVTKYINGHGDVIGGAIIGSQEFIDNARGVGVVHMTGCVMSPFNAYLVIRGLKTLSLRMERHCASAMKVAEFLEAHPAVKKVYYPGLKSFEGYEVAKKQMKLPGGMLSFELNTDKATTAKVLDRLEMCKVAVSLGDPETLVEHAASMTHSVFTAEELAAAGIPETLVRVSVGLEAPEDIIADFEQALSILL